MTLTAAQLLALKNDIAANNNTVLINGVATAIKNVPHGPDNAQAIADWYNLVAPGNYLVWKSVTLLHDIQNNPGWDWTRVDNLSVGKARIWEWMFDQTDSIPSGLGNYRTGINAVWVGTSADLAVQAAVNATCQRAATNAEKLLAVQTTTGPVQTGARGTSTNPDTLGVDGNILGSDVLAAWGP